MTKTESTSETRAFIRSLLMECVPDGFDTSEGVSVLDRATDLLMAAMHPGERSKRRRRVARYQSQNGEHYRIETEYRRDLATMAYGWEVSVVHEIGMGAGYPRLQNPGGYETEAAAMAYAVLTIEAWNQSESDDHADGKRAYDAEVRRIHEELRASVRANPTEGE